MSRPILMSLNPQWFHLIAAGMKTFEVRKRAPMQKHPYKVYLYCTKHGEDAYRAGVIGKFESYKMNGTVCGEFTCAFTVQQTPPWSLNTFGTCLTARQLCDYAGGAEYLYYMAISNFQLYEKPKRLEDFGMKIPPVSWQYIDEEDIK